MLTSAGQALGTPDFIGSGNRFWTPQTADIPRIFTALAARSFTFSPVEPRSRPTRFTTSIRPTFPATSSP